MSDSTGNAVDTIIDAIKAIQKEEITGALLGELVRKAAPNLNIRAVVGVPTGAGALSKFIDAHLSSLLKRDRRSGTDWIYKIQLDQTSRNHAADERSWNVFLDSSGGQTLLLDKDRLSLVVKDNEEVETEQSHVKIPGITRDELKEIQKRFVESILDESTRNELSGFVAGSYANWTIGLKRFNGNLYGKWAKFRRDEIARVFSARLENLGLDVKQKEFVTKALIDSQSRLHDERKRQLSSSREIKPLSLEDSSFWSTNELDHKFRETLLKVVSNMTTSELREIRLPFGRVFDVLNKEQ